MERMYRLALVALFIIGFIGAVAGGASHGKTESSMVSILKDVRLAQQAHLINSGRWSIEAESEDQQSLDQIEKLFQDDQPVKTVKN